MVLDSTFALALDGALLSALAVLVPVVLRERRRRAAERREVREALVAAGAASLGDAVAALADARARGAAVDEIALAIDGLVQQHETFMAAIEKRDSVGRDSQRSFQHAIGELGAVDASVVQLTREVGEAGAAVEEMVASVSMVATNVAGLAQDVEGVSAAIGELATSVDHVASSAGEASQLSLEVDRKAKDGGVAVERLVASTREIAHDIGLAVAQMQALGTASDRIGAIVEAIDAIADQTNLLALNAAIEAARAGEHGRGFAVVADEVRKLAESSAHSTREIGALVKDIQAKIGEVVRSTAASGTKAESGLQSADHAGRAIADISTAVAEANRRIEAITLAAREQSTSAAAIVESAERMSVLVGSASGSLREQTEANRQLIDIIAEIRRHASGVEEAGTRQRAAVAQHVTAAKALIEASNAAREARTAFDGMPVALQERVRVLVPVAV